MKVFISWSGELSKQLGQTIRTWLPRNLQSIKPYFSPADIEKGAKWDNEISRELEESTFGIIAMTRDAQSSHWISFEAGALSKQVDRSRICPVCFDLEPTDIQGPLSRFQAVRFSKEEIFQLLSDMNAALKDARLSEGDLAATFEVWWPKLDSDVKQILSRATPTAQGNIRPDRELLEETLLIVRGMQGIKEQVAQISQGLITTSLGTYDEEEVRSHWSKAAKEKFRRNLIGQTAKSVPRKLDLVVSADEHLDVVERILTVLPGSKIESKGDDSVAVRFKATDDEVQATVRWIKEMEGVLEVDRA